MASPVYRLPSELLSQIFLILTQNWLYSRSVGDRSDRRIHYPTMLSSVCVRWRQVATNSPSLWSHLYFNQALYTPKGLYLAKNYLARSSGSPISLYIGRYAPQPALDTISEELASLLASLMVRIESLALKCMHSVCGKQMLSSLFKEGAGRIQKLALYAPSANMCIVADPLVPQETLDRLLQPLRNLYLEGVAFNWSTIACRNLVELQLIRLPGGGFDEGSQLVEFLNANPAIRRLKVAGSTLNRSEHPPSSRITLPSLQNLELDVNQGDIHWFFTLLVPVSQNLTLKLRSHNDFFHNAPFVIALRRFFQNTRVVSLCIMGERWLPFSAIFTRLPHLERLGIHNPGQPDFDLAGSYMQEVLPNLHTVELVGCNTQEVESGLWIILFLPSVRNVLFTDFSFIGEVKKVKMTKGQVKEWMIRLGITANVHASPHLALLSHPSPFL